MGLSRYAMNLFQAGLREYMGTYKSKTQGSQYNGWGITGHSVSASKILDIPSGTCSIMKYFHGQCPPCSSSEKSQDSLIQDAAPLSPSESESYSGLNLTEPQILFPGEENEIKHAIPTLDHQEDKSKTWEDQDPSCLSSQQMQNNIAQETSPLLPSGSESCLGMSQSEQQREFSTEESRIKYAMPSLDRGLQKRKTSKEKGTSSIRRFFKTCDPISFRKQEHVEAIQLQDVQAASSVGFQASSSICSEPNQTELPMESILEQTGTNNGCSTLAHIEQQSESWRYKVDEIDPSVVMELPPEIQEEVQAWLRPHKRPNVVKKGSSIAHCFLPAKNRQLYQWCCTVYRKV